MHFQLILFHICWVMHLVVLKITWYIWYIGTLKRACTEKATSRQCNNDVYTQADKIRFVTGYSADKDTALTGEQNA